MGDELPINHDSNLKPFVGVELGFTVFGEPRIPDRVYVVHIVLWQVGGCFISCHVEVDDFVGTNDPDEGVGGVVGEDTHVVEDFFVVGARHYFFGVFVVFRVGVEGVESNIVP